MKYFESDKQFTFPPNDKIIWNDFVIKMENLDKYIKQQEANVNRGNHASNHPSNHP